MIPDEAGYFRGGDPPQVRKIVLVHEEYERQRAVLRADLVHHALRFLQ